MLFDSIGFVEFLVLVVIALVVFGPERLPQAAKKAAHLIRQLRQMANNARDDLSEELGPEIRDLDLNDIRNPRRAVQKYVLDGVDEDDLRVDKDLDLRKDLDEFDRNHDDDRRSTRSRGRDRDGDEDSEDERSSDPSSGSVGSEDADDGDHDRAGRGVKDLEGWDDDGESAGVSTIRGSSNGAGGSHGSGRSRRRSPSSSESDDAEHDADAENGDTLTLRTETQPPFDPDAT